MKQRLLLCIMLVSVILVFQQPTASTAQSAQFADATIDTTFPTYTRLAIDCTGPLFPVHYTTEQFTVTVSGEYDFRIRQSSTPAYTAIYRNFNPSQPELDCVDSAGPNNQPSLQPSIVANLQANTTYVMVKACRYPDIPQFPMPCTWIYDVAFGPGIVQTIPGNPDPPIEEPPSEEPPTDTEPEPPLFNDDRLNQPYFDKIALYNRFDADGNPSLHVYCIGENGDGNFWTDITVDKIRDTAQQLEDNINQGIFDPTAVIGTDIESNRPAQSTAECPYSLSVDYVRPSDLNPEREPYLEVIIFDRVERKFFRVRLDDVPVLQTAAQQPVDPPADTSPPSTDPPAAQLPVGLERLENHPFIDKAAIYNGTDADGNPTLIFYCIDEQSNGVLMDFISQPELTAFQDDVYQEALNRQLSGSSASLDVFRLSAPGATYSPPPAGCPYQFSLIAGVSDPIRAADGTIIDYGRQSLVLEVLDTAQRKQHTIFFTYPLPATIESTSSRDY